MTASVCQSGETGSCLSRLHGTSGTPTTSWLAEIMAPSAAKHNLSLVPLASPTSGAERIQQAHRGTVEWIPGTFFAADGWQMVWMRRRSGLSCPFDGAKFGSRVPFRAQSGDETRFPPRDREGRPTRTWNSSWSRPLRTPENGYQLCVFTGSCPIFLRIEHERVITFNDPGRVSITANCLC